MPIVRTEVFIRAPAAKVFDAARDVDLHAKTCEGTKERVIDGRLHGLLELGDTVTFEATHLGVKQRLTSKIVEFDRPQRFVDEMQKGAFKRLRHEHLFQAADEGTLMIDILDFQSPLGPLGSIVDRLFLRNYMRGFLLERGLALKKMVEE